MGACVSKRRLPCLQFTHYSESLNIVEAENFFANELGFDPQYFRFFLEYTGSGEEFVFSPTLTLGEAMEVAKYHTAIDWEKGRYYSSSKTEIEKVKAIMAQHRRAPIDGKWKRNRETDLRFQPWRVGYKVDAPPRYHIPNMNSREMSADQTLQSEKFPCCETKKYAILRLSKLGGMAIPEI